MPKEDMTKANDAIGETQDIASLQSLRIGFDAKRAAQNRTGLGNYSRFVVRMLSQLAPKNDYILYVPNRRRTPFLGEIPTLGRLRLRFAGGLWARLGSLWRVAGLWRSAREDKLDLYHGLSNELPLFIRRAGCKTIVTIHDLIFLRHPEYYKPIDRWIYNWKFRRACRVADRIIAVSEFTKRDIVKFYGIDEERISVVYQGCDPAFSAPIAPERLAEVRKKYDLPTHYILYVGSIEERKNFRLLLLAQQRAAKRPSGAFPIVAVGRSTAYAERMKRMAAEAGLADKTLFLHGVPFDDLPSLYRLATAFVYPSVVEGFGIPMLEAISSGLPAIGCAGSCLEEAGGPGSIYVGKDDAEGLAEAIERVMGDERLRARMVAEGREYARSFTDERLCSRLAEVYREVIP